MLKEIDAPQHKLLDSPENTVELFSTLVGDAVLSQGERVGRRFDFVSKNRRYRKGREHTQSFEAPSRALISFLFCSGASVIVLSFCSEIAR